MSQPQAGPSAEDEVVDLCRDLIRIDTVNHGDGSGRGARRAEYVAALLADVGLRSQSFESEPGRASVIARVEGRTPVGARSSSTATSMSWPPTRPRLERRPVRAVRSRTAACGVVAPST